MNSQANIQSDRPAVFDPIAAAHAIVPTLEETSLASEEGRQIAASAVAALAQSGLSRMLTPITHNGFELSPSAHIRSCRILAEGCSATAWVHMVCGAHNFVLGRYPQECQQEVFDGNPDALIPGTLAPQGLARQTEDGWILNGRWQFSSGVDHGDWLLIGARAVDSNGEDALLPVHVFVPKRDVKVLDTWHTLGMRGTGSKDLIAEDVFVPAHRSMATPTMFNGDFAGDAGDTYRLPVAGGLAAMLSATVLGIAERGLNQFVDATRVREDVYHGGSKAEKTSIQLRVAEARGELEVAALLMNKNCDLFDQALANCKPVMDLEQRAAIRWNAAYIVELCRRATERVFAVAGAHAIYNDSGLQVVYRDINTACHHAIIDFDGIAESRGKIELGLTSSIVGI
jgi:3-hydroxy-9,10-secoandrosta-1,3,5(10)-triene-9,17-dione monooxygenase